MRRRHALGVIATAVGVTAATAAWRYWPEQGLFNPCRAALPRELVDNDLVHAAWEGLDPAQLWDSHAHLVGTGDSGGGIVVNPKMLSLLNPVQYAQRVFFMNAGCVHDAPGKVDESYVERMHNLIDGMRDSVPAGIRHGVKLLLFAFDCSVDLQGEVDWERTAFHVPNAYAAAVARQHPDYFEWVASIHPYRRDCAELVLQAARSGARAVKWLPAAMGIDPASPLCDRFYRAMAERGLPLITHAGMERAVEGAGAQEFGNPLRLRRALDHGVQVVVAHCGSMGQDHDTDRGHAGPLTDSFELFSRLMDETRYADRLYGDISAMTQLTRARPALARVIERKDWHPRLLNGSDYPLPGVMPLYSVDYMVAQKFIEPSAAPILKGVREHNPLLFDFVLKRSLRWNGARLAGQIFETRRFFDRTALA
ncbi:MAG: amidohydrolase [Betaproteobacteria bacterium]|nr:amidohydrolase [Betaproteobacteria bacterium]